MGGAAASPTSASTDARSMVRPRPNTGRDYRCLVFPHSCSLASAAVCRFWSCSRRDSVVSAVAGFPIVTYESCSSLAQAGCLRRKKVSRSVRAPFHRERNQRRRDVTGWRRLAPSPWGTQFGSSGMSMRGKAMSQMSVPVPANVSARIMLVSQ